MTGQEALKEFKGNNNTKLVGRAMGKQHYLDCLQVMEKSLKALEIIKEKNVSVLDLRECNSREIMGNIPNALEYYNERYTLNEGMKLTEEEFNLLKEILGC